MGPVATPSVDRTNRHLPGTRALGSAGFRMIAAAALVIIVGVLLTMLMLSRAASPTGQFGIDAGDYLTAADRLAAGASPYAAEMLDGPIDSQGVDRYRYPPVFAQLLVPLTGVDRQAALWTLLGIQAIAIAAAVGLALRAARLLRPEPILWAAAATLLFLPVFDSLWKGNVSGFLALLVSLAVLGGATGGSAVALAALLKLAPVTFVPAWLLADRRSRMGMVATGLLVVGVSLLLAPVAWRDYVQVLPNLLAGGADEATNVAPWSVVARSGWPALTGDLVRVASILIAIGATAGAVLVVRRPEGTLPAATLATMAMLLLPAALWYHYLVVLLPIGILAWPLAGTRARAALVVAGTCVSAAVAWLPLATLGATLFLVVSLRAQLRAAPPASRPVVSASR